MLKIGILLLEVALGLVVTVTSIILNPEDLIASAPEFNVVVFSNLSKTPPSVPPANPLESSSSSSQE